jgi:hypothetical protein
MTSPPTSLGLRDDHFETKFIDLPGYLLTLKSQLLHVSSFENPTLGILNYTVQYLGNKYLKSMNVLVSGFDTVSKEDWKLTPPASGMKLCGNESPLFQQYLDLLSTDRFVLWCSKSRRPTHVGLVTFSTRSVIIILFRIHRGAAQSEMYAAELKRSCQFEIVEEL